MEKKGLTMTIIFLAESANYGESIGNVAKSRCRQNTDFYAITKTRCSEI